jgi:hypothetical protein
MVESPPSRGRAVPRLHFPTALVTHFDNIGEAASARAVYFAIGSSKPTLESAGWPLRLWWEGQGWLKDF